MGRPKYVFLGKYAEKPTEHSVAKPKSGRYGDLQKRQNLRAKYMLERVEEERQHKAPGARGQADSMLIDNLQTKIRDLEKRGRPEDTKKIEELTNKVDSLRQLARNRTSAQRRRGGLKGTREIYRERAVRDRDLGRPIIIRDRDSGRPIIIHEGGGAAASAAAAAAGGGLTRGDIDAILARGEREHLTPEQVRGLIREELQRMQEHQGGHEGHPSEWEDLAQIEGLRRTGVISDSEAKQRRRSRMGIEETGYERFSKASGHVSGGLSALMPTGMMQGVVMVLILALIAYLIMFLFRFIPF